MTSVLDTIRKSKFRPSAPMAPAASSPDQRRMMDEALAALVKAMRGCNDPVIKTILSSKFTPSSEETV